MSALAKIRYTHDAMIDLVIAEPSISQAEIAFKFGYTQAWVSQVFSADAFKARLAERRGELVDPSIVANVEERLEGLARQSIEVLSKSLEANPKPDVALKALEISTRSLGYGVKAPQVQVNNVVAFVPQKSISGDDWEKQFAVGGVKLPPVPAPITVVPSLADQS